ncbi:MAG: hypothetical protein JWN95_663 [Frankiales bacterium]|nr:hypothetical protein [Frankiales bacterium]
MAFNWVIYAPDGHAKNYSVLLRAQEAVPAPLYDISSVLPYPDRYDLRTMAMAMSVNGKYQNNLVTGGDWALLADKLLIDRELMSTWVRDIVVNAADAFADAIHDDAEWVSGLFVAAALVDNVATHAHRLSRFLDTAAPSARRPSRSAKPRPSDS